MEADWLSFLPELLWERNIFEVQAFGAKWEGILDKGLYTFLLLCIGVCSNSLKRHTQIIDWNGLLIRIFVFQMQCFSRFVKAVVSDDGLEHCCLLSRLLKPFYKPIKSVVLPRDCSIARLHEGKHLGCHLAYSQANSRAQWVEEHF